MQDLNTAPGESAGHLNFTDLSLVSPLFAKMLGVGETDPLTCIEDVNEMVLCFFDCYLKEDGQIMLEMSRVFFISTVCVDGSLICC